MPDDPWDRVRELAGRTAQLVGAVRPGERKPFGELDISMRSLVACLHQLGRKAEARDVSRVFEVFLNTEAEAAEWRQGGPAPAVQESLLYCSDAYKRLYNAKLKLGQMLQDLSIFLQPVQRQSAPTGHGVQIAPQEQPSAKEKIKEPSADAIAAYRFVFLTGMKQSNAAAALAKEWRRPVNQGQVSRWLREVKAWIKAGNVLPNLDQQSTAPPVRAADPAKLDYLTRPDGRTRPRKSRLQYDPSDGD